MDREPLPRQSHEVNSEPTFSPGKWLIFTDSRGMGSQLANHLASTGDKCFFVEGGSAFAQLADRHWQISPASRNDMQRLIPTIAEQCNLPWQGIVHLWSLDAISSEPLQTSDLDSVQDLILLSTLNLVQSWEGARDGRKPK